MSDFISSGWGYYVAIVALTGVVFCLWLLFTQRKWLRRSTAKIDETVDETGHVWDGDITELNTLVPRWWTVMYIGLCVIGLGYWLLYPGLGTYKGLLEYSSAKEVKEQQEALQKRIQPIYDRFKAMDIPEIAADPEAQHIGQRLFLNNCAQCHGSDAKGGPSFPNLADPYWLYGGKPEDILHSITEGRRGIMPAWNSQVTPAEASDIAQYVRSLSGLASDPLQVVRGKRGFESTCVACHMADGTGNTALGAPNLTVNTWMYGSSEASIVETILNGRDNEMPAQKAILTEDQIRLLTAWVWGLSNNETTQEVSQR